MNVFNDFNLNKFKNQKPFNDSSLATFKEIKDIDSLYSDINFVKYHDNIPRVFKNLIEKYGYNFPSNLVSYLLKNTESLIISLKNYHNRSRPNEVAKNYNIDLNFVKLKTAQTKSYPSGHSTQAELIGLVLSDMFPNLRTQIMKQASNISLSRKIAKVHYNSDIKNGKHLGKKLYEHYKLKKHAL